MDVKVDGNVNGKEVDVNVEKQKQPPQPEKDSAQQHKGSLLPKRVIAVFGPESSGTKFLSSTIGAAVGAFPSEGQWSHVVLPSNTSSPTEEWIFHQHNYRRAMSPDGEWEIQHLSLPWGWLCENGADVGAVVEALVPAACFRYESNPELSPDSAERIWHSENESKHKISRKKRHMPQVLEADAVGNGHNNGIMSDSQDAAAIQAASAEQCRNEVHIESDSSSWTCGAKCGEGQHNGYALYPKRFFVNITSHIEWYLSRGVEVTALLSMRDRSISTKSKLTGHCHVPGSAKEEDKLALSLMKESLQKYGHHHHTGRPHAIAVSYEGLMQFKGVYLFDLYKKLGIDSTYLPKFDDGNEKYVKDALEYLPALTPKERYPNAAYILPKKVITVLGPESSGTTFLSTVLRIAVGASEATELSISRQERSQDGEWEIQHLSLPWGWQCEEDEDIHVVDALVPEKCFRYERDPSLEPRKAAQIFSLHISMMSKEENATEDQAEKQLLSMCRDEVKISEEDSRWTCGAKCGTGKYDGYALYPQRFSVNITSHIEWYLSRGVDIKVVLSMRDRTISNRGKLKGHCHLADVGRREDEVALSLMAEAMEKYGKSGSRRGSLPED
ncbi:hypothetical protein ACHAXR_002500, partial [Thalassiosira sp. AJA248-18]